MCPCCTPHTLCLLLNPLGRQLLFCFVRMRPPRPRVVQPLVPGHSCSVAKHRLIATFRPKMRWRGLGVGVREVWGGQWRFSQCGNVQ